MDPLGIIIHVMLVVVVLYAVFALGYFLRTECKFFRKLPPLGGFLLPPAKVNKMTSKLIHAHDVDKGSDVYFDPIGVEGALIEWTGKKDYSQYIYSVKLYMRSGNIISCVVNEDGKKKILEHVQ
ncbi:hypothetical protein R4666_08890 [Acinetobacter baumannii]|nr:hypothetical protein [Acinetobacter baumannii]